MDNVFDFLNVLLDDTFDQAYDEAWAEDMRDMYSDYELYDPYQVEWPYAYHSDGFNMKPDGIEFSDLP